VSDSDRNSNAWRVPPSAYLETRPTQGPASKPSSLYVTMPDGCRLALDVYLPFNSPARVSAILPQSPSNRRLGALQN
jgi:predicted acyl esterase